MKCEGCSKTLPGDHYAPCVNCWREMMEDIEKRLREEAATPRHWRWRRFIWWLDEFLHRRNIGWPLLCEYNDSLIRTVPNWIELTTEPVEPDGMYDGDDFWSSEL